MESLAPILGVFLCSWCLVGPLLGYLLARRGWRIRLPIAREEPEE